ncbi:hypothetical protein ACFY1S_12305 [Micromonospora sp. NPDC000663]|uniref:hypothetical protein n=1 Tax=Micromonospora sp. NPDC000663 TaxID=3364218 RepID=UPI0036CA052A
MIVALHVGPVNRFLLRAAARFYIYRDEPDRALYLLNNHHGHLSDPWVLSAEIATSNFTDRTSKHIRRGRKMIEDRSIGPWHISELASAISAVELRSGRIRQARKMMAVALEQPTENSLAQAEWSSSHGLALPAEAERADLLEAPTGYEARALYFASTGDYEKAVTNGMMWLADQPFALDPAIFTSYTAAVLAGDDSRAAEAASAGLRAYPHAEILLNNYAFACARSGRLAEAEAALDRIRSTEPSDTSSAISIATRGLLLFKLGQINRGRDYYQRAISALLAFRQNEAAALAALYWAEEELLVGQADEVDKAMSRAGDLAKKAATAAVKARSARLLATRSR